LLTYIDYPMLRLNDSYHELNEFSLKKLENQVSNKEADMLI